MARQPSFGVTCGCQIQTMPSDKQFAAIALLHDLTVVTGHTDGFASTGVRLLNPFRGA